MNAEEVPARAVPLSVDPQSIDFGSLKPGHGANATLKVSGKAGQVIVQSDRLRVTPASFGAESNELQLMLLGGAAGELLWDDILLQWDAGELKVLVTARWEELTVPRPEPESVPVPKPMRVKQYQKEKESQKIEPELGEDGVQGRTFKGRTCRWCGRNIRYDTDSHSWKSCETCRGARVPIYVILRISREFYLGVKELRPALIEIWETLIGKEGHKD